MTVDAPLPSAPRCDVAERLDLPLVTRVGLGTDSAGLFVADFGAVVFAITLFLCADNLQLMNASGAAAFRAHQKDETRAPVTGGVSPFYFGGFHAPRGIGLQFSTRRGERQGTLLGGCYIPVENADYEADGDGQVPPYAGP